MILDELSRMYDIEGKRIKKKKKKKEYLHSLTNDTPHASAVYFDTYYPNISFLPHPRIRKKRTANNFSQLDFLSSSDIVKAV